MVLFEKQRIYALSILIISPMYKNNPAPRERLRCSSNHVELCRAREKKVKRGYNAKNL